MKEIDIVEEEIISVQNHPGNINSNLNGNLPWKERLDEIVSSSDNLSSEFNVALNGMCHVIKRINLFIKIILTQRNFLKVIANV